PKTPGDENTTPAETSDAEKTATAKPARPRPVRVPRAASTSRTKKPTATTNGDETTAATSSPAEPAAPTTASPGARLVLIMRDGGRLEREMGSIRRVTVENGMILIVTKNGRTERQPMADVVRMSIEP
ncbi:MAG TPA: hypothetical protein VJT82_03595, partial [Pyrinomonadaceae bacterium]|nr:hypothetical protein [Pyrinomonadaceae bacterium]